MASKRYFLTTAIAYPNGPPHIGHAYEAIATDAIARFMRLDGYDVFFLTGTDEHGIKMLQTAAKEGLTAHELAERNVPLFQAMVKRLNCSNDDFIRTTDERHHESSREIWLRMEKNGDVYLSKYSGWYSVRDEAFYGENETTVGEDGVRRGPTGTPVEWVEEESYFFRLSAYQDKLLDLYARVPDFVLPKERLNEVASFVRGGLQDLSISRTTFDWGIRVPGDDKHIMYVWVDALTNYITGVGFPDTDSEMFRRYWPADLHVIGKDIVRFHAVYWPAFLMSAGIEVPRRVFSHGFLFNRGEKMSKSVGNVIDPFALADAYGVDQLRYFFLREVPFGQDGNYSHEAIVARINADLANDLGNLAQRSLTMIGKAFSGMLPAPGAFSANDNAILAAADAMIGKVREAMATQQLHQVLNAVWAVVADANRYFAGEAPWALAKTDPQRQGTVLYVTAEVLRQIAILAQPFMPDSAARLLDLLGIPAERTEFRDARRRGTHCPRHDAAAARAGLPPLCRSRSGGRRPMMLVDSHCHLDFPDLAGDLDAIVARAEAAGIGRMVTISTRVRRHDALLAIAERFAPVYCSVGTHPHHAAEERDVTLAELLDRAARPKVVAIGEAGLDYFYDRSPRDVQERVFRTHIAAARESRLPLVIHTRDADADMARILEDETGKQSFVAVLHCFSAGRDLGPMRDRARSLHLVHRDPHLQEVGRAAVDRGVAARRPHHGRDRCALSRPAIAARQTQRAGLRRRDRADARRNPRRFVRHDRQRDHRELLPSVRQGAAPGGPSGMRPPASRLAVIPVRREAASPESMSAEAAGGFRTASLRSASGTTEAWNAALSPA